MSARWSWVGPRGPHGGGAAGEGQPLAVVRQAWAASWLTQACLLGAVGAAAGHAVVDTVTVLRDTWAVVVDQGDVKVVKEWRR